MSRVLLFGLAAMVLAAGLVGDSGAQTKPKVVVATDEHYALLSTYGEMVGVVQGTVAAAGKSPAMIALRVQFDHAKAPNANVGPTAAQQQRMQKLQQDLAVAGAIKNPQQRQQKMAQIQNDIAQLNAQVKDKAAKPAAMVKELIDYDLPLTEKAVVRKKGAGSEDVKFGDLTKGDEVKVTFAARTAVGAAAPKKDASGALLDVPANRPRVREVLILKDVPETLPKKK